MHSDIDALDIVCIRYRTEYGLDALRKTKNKIQRLMHTIVSLTIKLYYVRALLKVWKRGGGHSHNRLVK